MAALFYARATGRHGKRIPNVVAAAFHSFPGLQPMQPESAIDLSHVTFPHLVMRINDCHHLLKLHIFHNLDNFDYLGHSPIMRSGFPDIPSLAVKREKELHRQILAFSISHDHCSVRIYGHYPMIEGEKTTYYRHAIHKFDFTSLDGKEKWTSYKFSMSVYNDWAPSHFKKICSAIDELPQVNFEVSQASQISQQPEVLHQSELSFSESTRLSQGIRGVDIQGSSFTSVLEEADGVRQRKEI
ncbi:hypothetical protein I7I51_00388 [Histoplasma capsulatum]|uniref:DUF7924 domain-containing protein n=1 Tax=Ajellomyces capsulatus TaxID=5037 RepID=A0A8A1MBG6_AJECA|nr:predicted protein [Histoplasma mississippiense (nom. inval.)]EDN08738.1 predicted protein [Histoplasma mississippiense (nom. inval.)]QSS63331.1 hypothetical protein I7I51_00388 [Histoplasma capsulatum]